MTTEKSNHKKVLLVGNFLSESIGRSVCEDLALRLETAGWNVYSASSKMAKFSRLIDMMGTAWKNRSGYEVAHVDVYSGPAFFWAEATCWTLRRAGKPYVLTLRGGNLPEFSARWPRRVRNLLHGAKVVTTPSNYLLHQMNSYRKDMRLLPNPLELRNYPFHLRSHPKPNLVWLRAFHAIYNPTMAPEVVALLKEEFPDVQLTMVGPDKGVLNATQAKAEQLDVKDRIRFVGKVPKSDIAKWMNEGDIFLNTTDIDNTPVSVLEAMACGLCVVSTNVGGIPYLLKEGEDSLLVPPGKPEEMAFAVKRLLREPGLAESISRNAREKARIHDWQTLMPEWEELLQSSIEVNGR